MWGYFGMEICTHTFTDVFQLEIKLYMELGS